MMANVVPQGSWAMADTLSPYTTTPTVRSEPGKRWALPVLGLPTA